jgi:hypothetical protein
VFAAGDALGAGIQAQLQEQVGHARFGGDHRRFLR